MIICNWITSSRFSLDNQILLTSWSRNGFIDIWKNSGQHLERVRHLDYDRNNVPMQTDIAKDNSLLVSGSQLDGKINIWHLRSGRTKSFIDGSEDCIYNVAISSDKKYIFSFGDNENEEPTIWLWDVPRGRVLQKKTYESDFGYSLDNNMIKFVSKDSLILLYGEDEFPVLMDLGLNIIVDFSNLSTTKEDLTAVQVTPDNDGLLLGYHDGSIQYFDFKGNLVRTFSFHSRDIHWFHFSTKNPEVFLAWSREGKSYSIWNLESLVPFTTRKYSTEIDYDFVLLSSDGKSVMTTADNIYFWDLNNKIRDSIISNYNYNLGWKFSPDDSHFVSLSNEGFQLYDRTKKNIHTFNVSNALGKDRFNFIPGTSQIWYVNEDHVAIWYDHVNDEIIKELDLSYLIFNQSYCREQYSQLGPDNKTIISFSHNTIYLDEPRTFQEFLKNSRLPEMSPEHKRKYGLE